MVLRKLDFYEGAALRALACTGLLDSVRPNPPFFLINDAVNVLLKYSTRSRSPWGFTFTAEEQQTLLRRADNARVIIGLICGSDGVSALEFESYKTIARPRPAPLRVSCFRDHGQLYAVRGPDGELPRKISPSAWSRILASESAP